MPKNLLLFFFLISNLYAELPNSNIKDYSIVSNLEYLDNKINSALKSIINLQGAVASTSTILDVLHGGTGANTPAGARTNLGVPSLDGTGAVGTWNINITGNAATATDNSKVLKSGDTMSGTLNMNGNNIINVSTLSIKGNGSVTYLRGSPYQQYDITYTLPISTDIANGYILTSDINGNLSWQPPPIFSGENFYFTNTLSGTSNYYLADVTQQSNISTFTVSSIPDGEYYMGSWIVPEGYPLARNIESGFWKWGVYAKKTSGTKNLRIFGKFYVYTSTGGLIYLGETGYSNEITSTIEEYNSYISTSEIVLNTDDRILVQGYVYVYGNGNAPTIEVYFGGKYYSHMSLPTTAMGISNFVPYSGAIKDVNLGNNSITANNFYGNGYNTDDMYNSLINEISSRTYIADFRNILLSTANYNELIIGTISFQNINNFDEKVNYVELVGKSFSTTQSQEDGSFHILTYTDGIKNEVFTIKNNRIGINNTAPNYSLDVNGGLRVENFSTVFNGTVTFTNNQNFYNNSNFYGYIIADNQITAPIFNANGSGFYGDGSNLVRISSYTVNSIPTDAIQDNAITDDKVVNTITLNNITQITNRSHTNLSDIGSYTHSQIDTKLDDLYNVKLNKTGDTMSGDLIMSTRSIKDVGYIGTGYKIIPVSDGSNVVIKNSNPVFPIDIYGDALINNGSLLFSTGTLAISSTNILMPNFSDISGDCYYYNQSNIASDNNQYMVVAGNSGCNLTIKIGRTNGLNIPENSRILGIKAYIDGYGVNTEYIKSSWCRLRTDSYSYYGINQCNEIYDWGETPEVKIYGHETDDWGGGLTTDIVNYSGIPNGFGWELKLEFTGNATAYIDYMAIQGFYTTQEFFGITKQGSRLQFTINSSSYVTLNDGNYLLNVDGNINFTGDLYKNGVIYTSSSGGDNLGNHIATMTITANYGMNVSSILVTGVGIGGSDELLKIAGSTMVVLNNGNVGIGTTYPQVKLDINGQIKIVDGTQGAGKVLTSDVNGIASWQVFSVSGDNLGNHIATMTITADYGISASTITTNLIKVSTIVPVNDSVIIRSYSPNETSDYFFPISIGYNSYNNYYYGIGIGQSAHSNYFLGVGIGYSAYNNYLSGVGIGNGADNNFYDGVGIGVGASNNYYNGVGIGSLAKDNFQNGIGIGDNARNNNTFGIGIGYGASNNNTFGIGIGYYSVNNSSYAIGIGAYSYASSTSIAIGSLAKANATESIAIGAGTINNSTGTASFGNYSIFTSSSITASEFYGDGTKLSGLVPINSTPTWTGSHTFSNPTTFISSVTIQDKFGVGSSCAYPPCLTINNNGVLSTTQGNISAIYGSLANFTGNVTANSFYGNGSNLTNISSVSINSIYTGAIIDKSITSEKLSDIISISTITVSTISTTSNLIYISTTVRIGGYTLPFQDGNANYVLKTDGAGNVTWSATPAGASISAGDSNVSVTDSGDGYITFTEDNSEIMRISGGNLGIGTTSPKSKLDVNGSLNISGNAVFNSSITINSYIGNNSNIFLLPILISSGILTSSSYLINLNTNFSTGTYRLDYNLIQNTSNADLVIKVNNDTANHYSTLHHVNTAPATAVYGQTNTGSIRILTGSKAGHYASGSCNIYIYNNGHTKLNIYCHSSSVDYTSLLTTENLVHGTYVNNYPTLLQVYPTAGTVSGYYVFTKLW